MKKLPLKAIRRRLKRQNASNLILIGNGNYHYVSYLLLERVKMPFSLILFDHHDDMKDDNIPLISCGSWVRHVLLDHNFLKKVCIIGVDEKNITAKMPDPVINCRVKFISEQKLHYTSLNIIANNIHSFLQGETNIYISIDKDVLYKKEAYTNWDQGSMSLVQLLYLLENLHENYQIVGMDICGEYVFTYEEKFDPVTWEHVKMNEIVNETLITFIDKLASNDRRIPIMQ